VLSKPSLEAVPELIISCKEKCLDSCVIHDTFCHIQGLSIEKTF